MRDPIYEELKSKVAGPPIVTSDIVTQPDRELNKNHLNTKQTITFTHDEVMETLEDFPVPMPRWMEKFCTDCKVDGSQFIGADDGYGLFEYFSKAKMFVSNPEYFRYVKHNDTPFIMNLYNGAEFDLNIHHIQKKINRIDTRNIATGTLMDFGSGSVNMKYSEFSNVEYCRTNRISQYMLRFPTLCINLPYEYYVKQDMPENIYTWDVDTGEFNFADKSKEDVINMCNDIIAHGIQTPLFLRISRGKIVSASDDDYVRLLIAGYLRLPTIPAVLYIMTNDIDKDMLISMRPSDIFDSYIIDKNIDNGMWQQANKICNPYFVFHNKKFSSIDDLAIIIDGKYYNWTKYTPDYHPSEEKCKISGCVDYYLKDV